MTFLKQIYIGATFSLLLLLSSCAKPIANFAYKSDKKEAPSEVAFENQSTKADSYEWDFGDGTNSTEASPKHAYKSSGNYEVVLKAKKGAKESVSTKRVFIDAPHKDCLVVVETDYGNLTIKLYNETPGHRDNFTKLVEEGFYNDLIFHRVINGFMIQGGDPNSRNCKPNTRLGSGGPGYQIPAEINESFIHKKGAICAARTGDNVNPEKKSSGSQFYIVHGRKMTADQLKKTAAQKGIRYSKEQIDAYVNNGGTPFLDQEYTVFGEVVEGMDVIDEIANQKTLAGDCPEKDIKMKIKLIK